MEDNYNEKEHNKLQKHDIEFAIDQAGGWSIFQNFSFLLIVMG